ncbi:hypothetical protein CYQ88_08680 [Hydrogenovibrio sp. SC-1]|uniref:flagellar hook-length control protein FliK n=1 Tax=Hydrogenovibrio sp. SC-1 TaxID=2065820 RepID=UPI000C795B0C|nr:flagellar hook-length control protein FliK [Hydrogenovibrio sp. SC-1]PLA73902.1 hypothetical protein CYQ88_08680 [Hydrogenovibrio sp. SC-1]
MIKQPILDSVLNPSIASSEAQQSVQSNGQSLPKGANGFAKLFVREASALKSLDGQVDHSKTIGSDIRLPSDVLSQGVDKRIQDADRASELETVLQQINQKIMNANSTVKTFDADSTPSHAPLTGEKGDKLASGVALLPGVEAHVVNPIVERQSATDKVAINGEAFVQNVLKSVQQVSNKNLKAPNDATESSAKQSSLKEGSEASIDAVVSNTKQPLQKEGLEVPIVTVSSHSNVDSNEASEEKPGLVDIGKQQKENESPTTVSLPGMVDDDVAMMTESGLKEVSQESIPSRDVSVQPVAYDSDQPMTRAEQSRQAANVEAQQSFQQGMNETHLESAQQARTVQSPVAGQAQAATQPSNMNPSASAQQPSSPQSMGASAHQSTFEQGPGQQGQSGHQGNSGQTQQQMQQAQAFAQLQKQDIARVQQEGVRSFNEALITEEAKAEKSEKLLGSLGVSLDGRAQLPSGMQTMSQPMRSPQWGQALGQRITYMANNKVQEAKITLNPEKLGTIQIKLNIDKDSQLHVSMTAQQGTTREAIENAMPRLREILDAAGIGLGSLDVRDERTFARDQNQDASQGGKDSGLNGSSTDADDEEMTETAPIEIATDNLVDYYA